MSWVSLTQQFGPYTSSALSRNDFCSGSCSVVIGGSLVLARAISSKAVRFGLPLAICFVSVLLLVNLTPGFDSTVTFKEMVFAAVICLILAVNTLPETWLFGLIQTYRGRFNLVFMLGVGFSEILFLKPFLLWLRDRRMHPDSIRKTHLLANWIPALLTVPALAVLPLTSKNLVEFSRMLHRDKAVRMFFKGNLNGMEFNRELGVLYAVGSGINHVLVFKVRGLEEPPQQSHTETARAQGLYFNPERRELYTYNRRQHAILILDSVTLELIDRIETPDLSPGDSWVVWDRFSDEILVSSEADDQKGIPFVAVNRTTKQVVTTLQMDVGNVLLHPDRPLLYLSCFRRHDEILAYDTHLHQIVKRVHISQRLDRMVHDSWNHELLVASPLHSRVLRYDSDSLQLKGDFRAPFGVRTLAIDERRNLLLCGSLATNVLEVIDLKTHRILADYYLGPWLRTICLDENNGVAYVTSNGEIFRVDYLSHRG